MTTTEERQELMAIARSLMGELETVKSEFAVIRQRIDRTINKLLEASDELKLVSANEIDRGESVTTKAVVYGKKGSGTYRAATIPPDAEVVEIPRDGRTPARLIVKRACGLCHEAGHRAPNCPNAHLVRAEKRATVEARPVKKKRGPVSAERKAKLVEQLKKARAARKVK